MIRTVWLIYKKGKRPARVPADRLSPDAAFFVRQDRESLKQAREAHRRTLQRILRVLRERELKVRLSSRSIRPAGFAADLVISVGGDGTFLEAARGVKGELLLGVNSDPQRSAGNFCAADAWNFEKLLDRTLEGKARIRKLRRLGLRLNGSRLPIEVLNDVLVTHERSAAMSRYWVRVGKVREDQRSSGLWAATAAGSTGAIRSAGGRKLPLESRNVQYLPREPYRPRGVRYRLAGGTVRTGTAFRIGSLMPGMICADGEHRAFSFRYGDVLEIFWTGRPLRCVGG